MPATPKKTMKHYSRVLAMGNKNRENAVREGMNVKYMFEPNENVEVITNNNAFRPNKQAAEVPKHILQSGLSTPPRSTRLPWGKPGNLPSNAPPRRSRKTRRNRK